MKMIAILACMLLVTTILPVVGPMNVDKTVAVEKSIQEENKVEEYGTAEMIVQNIPLSIQQFPWIFLNLDWDYWSNKPHMYAIPTGNVGIGTTSPAEKFQVAGIIYSTAGGFKFPDGTIQTTAAAGGGGDNDWEWSSGSGLTGNIYHIGEIGIGTTLPNSKLDVYGDVRITNPLDSDDYLRISSGDSATSLTHLRNGGAVGSVSIDSAGLLSAESISSFLGVTVETGDIIVKQGEVGIGTTSPDYKLEVIADGLAIHGNSEDASGVWGSSTNYIGVYGSGKTYDFYAGGIGTNYGPFTGAHEVKLSNNFPENVKPGLIVSVTGEAHIRKTEGGDISFSSTLPTVRLANVPNDNKVLGAIIAESSLSGNHWYINEADENDRFGIVNALGDGRVYVTDINGNVEAGDYITTSVIAGYGQKQDDDLLHSYTLGKAIENVDWDGITETIEYNGHTYRAYPIGVVYTSG